MTGQQDTSENKETVPSKSPEVKSIEPLPSHESKPATAADFQKVEQEMSGFERSTIRWTRASFFIVLATAVFIGLQWHEMRVGGEDTHTLAEAAKKEAEKSRIEERAWIEIEPIKPTFLTAPNDKFPALFTCNIYPKNVGRTAARDVVVKAQSTSSGEEFGRNAEWMRNTQDKLLLGGFKEMETNQPVVIPDSPVPKVLAPNTISPVPFRMTCAAPQVFPNGTQWLNYLVGRIDYCDQSQIKHWLKFCFYVVNARGEIWACQEGNDEDHNAEEPTSATSCQKPN